MTKDPRYFIAAIRLILGTCSLILGARLVRYCDSTFKGDWTWRRGFLSWLSIVLWPLGFILLLWKGGWW